MDIDYRAYLCKLVLIVFMTVAHSHGKQADDALTESCCYGYWVAVSSPIGEVHLADGEMDAKMKGSGMQKVTGLT